MARLKSIRHEIFARNYVITGSLAQAYRQTRIALNDPPLARRDYAAMIGYQIRRRPKVARRIEELRDIMAKKADITMDAQLTKHARAFQVAELKCDANAMNNIINSESKLVGLLRDRVETGSVGEFDGMNSIAEILEKVANDLGVDAALSLAKAFGLEKVEEATEDEEAAALMKKTPPTDSVN